MPATKESDLPEGHVNVRILPLGADKVYTGLDNPLGLTAEEKFLTFKRGDVAQLHRSIAEPLEAKGFVEIQ